MLEEGREVGTGAEVADADFFSGKFLIGGALLAVAGVVQPPLLVDGTAFWAGNGAGDLRTNSLREGTAEAEKSGPETATSILK